MGDLAEPKFELGFSCLIALGSNSARFLNQGSLWKLKSMPHATSPWSAAYSPHPVQPQLIPSWPQ